MYTPVYGNSALHRHSKDTLLPLHQGKGGLFRSDTFLLHVTSFNTGSVQVTHRAVGAKTMHGFGTDLVRNPAI